MTSLNRNHRRRIKQLEQARLRGRMKLDHDDKKMIHGWIEHGGETFCRF